MPQKYAVIVAGGKGTRMNSEVPKQFLPLNGTPIIIHTLQAFHRYSKQIKLILVLPEDDIQYWNQLYKTHGLQMPIIVCKGGKSRFQSVKNGLAQIKTDGLVAIHDGVRPVIQQSLIAASYNIAEIHHSAVAAVRLKESIRMIDKDSTKAMDRSRFRLIQTPQTFKVSMLKTAYEIEEDESLTDDASVFERAGYAISLFEGDYKNIKITTQDDLLIAEKMMKNWLH